MGNYSGREVQTNTVNKTANKIIQKKNNKIETSVTQDTVYKKYSMLQQ